MAKKKNDDMKKDAKKAMLKELIGEMRGMMGEGRMKGLEGLQKVTVAAPDEEGLEEGLSTAQKLMQMRESMMSEEDYEEDEDEEYSEEEEYEEDMDSDEEKLAKLKKAMKGMA